MSGYQKRFGGGAWRFHGIHGGSEIYFAIPRGNSHLRKFPSFVHTVSWKPTFKNISTLEGTFIKSPLGCPFLSNTPWTYSLAPKTPFSFLFKCLPRRLARAGRRTTT